MKKIFITILMIICMICIISNVSKAVFTVESSIDLTNIKVGDIITYTLSSNENVVAANFDIIYSNDIFELVGSDTTNLSVSKKDDKIACIYADITGTGTKEFKIKFKAIKENDDENVSFAVENTKFREVDAEESYTDVDIEEIKNIEVAPAQSNPGEELETTFKIQSSVTPTSVKVGDIITYTLKTNENVVAANFDIIYPNDKFELVESATNNLNVAIKDGKVACIYADMSGTGTKEFKVKFKAIAETNNATFSIENSKFRVVDAEESYTNTNVQAVNNIEVTSNNEEQKPSQGSNQQQDDNKTITTNKKDPTTSGKEIPNTGKGSIKIMMIFLMCIIVLSIIFKRKSSELNKIFKSIPIILIGFFIININTDVYAVDANPEIRYNDNLIANTKTISIMLDKSDSDNAITVDELKAIESSITNILDVNNTSLAGNASITTGCKVVIGDDTYNVILYGDANGDGTICDTDDIMMIINDYLGIQQCTGLNNIAANLANNDNILDIDDVMNMIDMYLGRLNGPLVTNLPNSNNAIVNDINVYLNGACTSYPNTPWTNNIIDRTIYLSSYVRFVSNTNYQIQIKIHSIDSRVEYYYHNNVNVGAGQNDTWIEYPKYIQLSDIDPKGGIGLKITTYNSSIDSNKPIISYRLYDTNTNRYSEEKTITMGELENLSIDYYNIE